MQPKLIKTMRAEYTPAEWTGGNKSGLEPFGEKVIVLPDRATTRSSGGIELPEELVERMNMSAESGILVAFGEDAFRKATSRPEAGVRVTFERYAGLVTYGMDGQEYRVMDDNCLGAKLTKDTEYTTKPLRSVT